MSELWVGAELRDDGMWPSRRDAKDVVLWRAGTHSDGFILEYSGWWACCKLPQRSWLVAIELAWWSPGTDIVCLLLN